MLGRSSPSSRALTNVNKQITPPHKPCKLADGRNDLRKHSLWSCGDFRSNRNAQMAPRNNCLTCARPMEADSLRVQDEDNTVIMDVLKKHFWFTEDDLLGGTICRICWVQVNQFHQFYILVEEVYQIHEAGPIVKSEPVVTEHASDLPETSEHELAVETSQQESLISVQEEPTLDIADDIQSGDKQPSDENDQIPVSKKKSNKDDFIRKHFDFACRECGADNKGFDEYMKHAMDVHGIKQAFIDCCGQKFYRKNNLYYHVQVLKDPDIFRCKLCRMSFVRSCNLSRHMKEQHSTKEEKKFKCDRCPRSFALMSSYRSHAMIHDPIYRCTECSLKFSRGYILVNHFATAHPGRNPFTCLRCQRTFTTYRDLSKHQRKMHSRELCNALTNSFQPQTPANTENLDENNPVTSEYEEHAAMQQKESTDLVKEEPDLETRPEISKCELDDTHQPLDSTSVVLEESALDVGCENETDIVQSGTENEAERFQKRRKWYRQHQDDIIKTHVNLNCKQCDVVSESFAQYFRHSLEAHNVELSSIECCGKQYINNPDVYRCKLCEKSFNYKYGRERHMKSVHRIETKMKFECDQCPRAFTALEEYHKHVKRHAGLRVQYPCPECPSSFYIGCALENHVASAHPGIQISSYQPLPVPKSDDLQESEPQPEPELKLEASDQHECSSIVKEEPALEIVDE